MIFWISSFYLLDPKNLDHKTSKIGQVRYIMLLVYWKEINIVPLSGNQAYSFAYF